MFPGIFRFVDFELDGNAYELRRNAHPLKLERIPLDLLFLLIEKRGQLVTREEILERLWRKGVFFDVDNAINTAVRKLRRALGDNPEAPRFVLTVPSKGHRFVAELDDLSPRPPRRAKKVGRASSGRLTQSPMAGRQPESESARKPRKCGIQFLQYVPTARISKSLPLEGTRLKLLITKHLAAVRA